MANLENLINEIPDLVDSLNLSIGNADHLGQEIIRINNLQDRFVSLQKELEGELGFQRIKNMAIGALPFLGTVASFFIPGGFLIDAAIAGGAGLIAEKFGDPEAELTLNDLTQMMEAWSEWGEWLKQVAEDIVSDSQIQKQLELNMKKLSLTARVKNVDANLRINLAFGDSHILQKQIETIIEVQDELLCVQEIANSVVQNINDSEDILEILVSLSVFFGQSGFTLEWIHDEHGLIISSNNQSQCLVDIVNKCQDFIEKIGVLIVQGNSFRAQAEQALRNLESQKDEPEVSTYQPISIQTVEPKKQPLLVIASSLIVLSLGSWIAMDKLLEVKPMSLGFHPGGSETANLKSAQQLAMEAAVMVQNPPHQVEVWQQAQAKWQQAVSLLQNIPEGTAISPQAKQQLATYRTNYEAIGKRLVAEKKAAENLKSAQQLAMEAAVMVQNPPHPTQVWHQAQLKWQHAIHLLESIPNGTFVSQQAKDKLSSYKTNYAAISSRVKK